MRSYSKDFPKIINYYQLKERRKFLFRSSFANFEVKKNIFQIVFIKRKWITISSIFRRLWFVSISSQKFTRLRRRPHRRTGFQCNKTNSIVSMVGATFGNSLDIIRLSDDGDDVLRGVLSYVTERQQTELKQCKLN